MHKSKSFARTALHPAVAVLLVLSATLLLSGVAAYRGRVSEMVIIIFGVVGVGLGVAVLRWPAIGVIAVLATGLVVPLGFDTGTQTRVSISLVLLAGLIVLWLGQALISKSSPLPSSRTVKPLLGFLAVAILAFGFGQQPWFAFAQAAPLTAQLGGLATFMLSGAAFLVAAKYLRSIKALRLFTWMFILIGGALIFARFVPGVSGIATQLGSRALRGSLFWTWLAAMAFSQAVLNVELRRTKRFVLLVVVAAIFYTGAFEATRWASGWIPPLVSVLTVALIAFPAPSMLAGSAAISLGFLRRQEVVEFVMIGDNPYSLATRLDALRILGEIIRVNPIFGLGPANYYWYTPLFPILGYSVRFSSHNNYVDIVAQTGILGLVAFLWFCLAVARVGWDLLGRGPPGFSRAYVVGAIGGLVGTLVAGVFGDWVIPFVYNVGLDGMRASLIAWLFLGGLIAVEQMVSRNTLEIE